MRLITVPFVQMQAKLRELGPKAMNAAEFERFSTMHKEGKLLPPDRYDYDDHGANDER